MQWSARMAALDLHRGLNLNQPTDKVMAYFAEQLQAAYDAGRNQHMLDTMSGRHSGPYNPFSRNSD